MALKKFNPTTPGQRQLVMVDRSALYKGKPVKALTEGKHSRVLADPDLPWPFWRQESQEGLRTRR